MPKLLRYKESYCAKAHAIGISCVAFSSQGSYLATAGLDGKVCIWEVKEFRLRYVYKSETPVLTALWLPNGEDSVLLGYQDGHVATLTHTSNVLSVNGFDAHDGCLELISVRGNMVATATQQEVRIWQWLPVPPWRFLVALPGPPKSAENLSLEVLIVGIHWTSWGPYSLVLVVSYQNHGLLLYDAVRWTLVHSVNIGSPIARTDLSPDGSRIVTYNLTKGIEVRTTADGAIHGALSTEVREKYILPVLFVHGDTAMVAGTTTGVANVWDSSSFQKIQALAHEDKDRILTIAAHYDARTDRFMIATGTYGSQLQPSVRLWVAEERCQAPQKCDAHAYALSNSLSENTPSAWAMYLVAAVAMIFTLLAFAPDSAFE